MPDFLAVAGEAVIDQSLVAEVFTLVGTAAKTLFTTYPLNVFVIMGIAGGAIGLIARGRRAAR